MNHTLQSKIVRALGYAVGAIGGARYHEMSSELRAKLDKAYYHLEKELDEIMKEFENERN